MYSGNPVEILWENALNTYINVRIKMLTHIKLLHYERRINFHLALQIAMFLAHIDGSRESINYICLSY